MEFIGFAAIVSVVTASFLIALFAGEALITWIIRAMDAAVKHADEQQGGSMVSHNLPDYSPDSAFAHKEFEVLPG